MTKTPSRTHRRRRLLELRVHALPPGPTATSRKWLRWICDDLVASVDRSARNPPNLRPKAAARRQTKTMSAAAGVSPYCWIESFVYGTCYVGGVEVPCRIEHWVCDDGTSFDREVPLQAALTAMKLSPATGGQDGQDGTGA